MLLTDFDRSALAGALGRGTRIAMELLVEAAPAMGAGSLLDISGAHIDGCLYHGQAGLDFAELLASGAARVRVPTTLNVASLDLIHPDLYRGDEAQASASRALMDAYVEMGCSPTWTCAPYQLAARPGLGDQVAWGESNAIVFANSVLGARTNRYGDFLDICCAVTGRAPDSGLHTDAGRQATVVVEVDVPDPVLESEITYPLLGHVLGAMAGTGVAAIAGLDQRADEDRLKALGAAAASSGSVAMFHVVGVTPEASTLDQALGGSKPERVVRIGIDDLRAARDELDGVAGSLGAVSVGTPHASLSELKALRRLAGGLSSRVPFYVNVGRDVLDEANLAGVAKPLEDFGVTFVTDTCTYLTPMMGEVSGAVMTNSGKWAYYAPGNIGVVPLLGSLGDCVDSAVAGAVVREPLW